jgi:hypothetical protein
MLLSVALRGGLALLLAVAWEFSRLVNGAEWSWEAVLARFFLVSVALIVSAWAGYGRRRQISVLGIAVAVCVVAIWTDLGRANTPVAWAAVAALYVALLTLESAFAAASAGRSTLAVRLAYGLGHVFLALFGAVTLGLLAQVESRFAEEEFFVAIQVAFLGAFVFLLLLAQILARRLDPSPPTRGPKLRPGYGILALMFVGAGFAWWSARAYQASFYSTAAPTYDGVSEESPFMCAELPVGEGASEGEDVLRRIQALVEANPEKLASEYGMLALITGDVRWAEAFREAIMVEAKAELHTQPANSVKYGQRLAARSAYYFGRVQERFPNLFSEEEIALVRDWFAAVNRRAMTVEWVDFLYGLAFSFWPQGPYENQENGAGLLALLELYGLGDTELAEANLDYLESNVRGWVERFRNTDDAYLYQTEWIDNALFQELFRGAGDDPATFERNRRLAFEWLLLQALPGGEPLTYNRPGEAPLANVFYLGALLTGDPRYLWAAEQSVTDVESESGYLYAQPGLEHSVNFPGVSPTEGSCLLFSPSGLPNQIGPLAPDKVVFRDGWLNGATYLLLNLRFTGWHRYKGTNSIVLLHQDGPIVVEESSGQPFEWLPTGRSLFRDKRIPRENLNGLLVERSGFSQVLYSLTGLFGPWAQDPPHYAAVQGFDTLGLLDASRTTIDDWRGWQHERTIYFLHQGPVIVVDVARKPGGGQNALTWHLAGPVEQSETGAWLRRDAGAIRVALPADEWRTTTLEHDDDQESSNDWVLTYMAPDAGKLDLVTAFLTNGWADAEFVSQPIEVAGEPVGYYVRASKDDAQIHLVHMQRQQVLHHDPVSAVAAAGFGTDGEALLVFEDGAGLPQSVCTLRGTKVNVPVQTEPDAIRALDGRFDLERGQDWEWQAGELTIWPPPSTSVCLSIKY